MPYVEAQHAKIHYVTVPNEPRCPPGRPVVTFVHGGGGNCYAFFKQLPFLAAEGFYAISIDVRGYGASRLERDDPDDCRACYFAADILAVLDAVGVKTTAIVGHSIGGFLATRLAMEAPQRVTHVVMSSTFYGLVDELPGGARPYITRYILHRQDVPWTECDRLAAEVKAILPRGSAGASHPSRTAAEGRRVWPAPNANVSDGFRAAEPEVAWLYDALRDANEQALRLRLGTQFRVMHAEGSVTPTALRQAYGGPVLFLVTECDSMVHWELVYHVAAQLIALGAGVTRFHWLKGDLYHAPNVEASAQYNDVLLTFLRDCLDEEPPASQNE
jgi:pimeloyl-ACP methyl ester carboxylesterase